MVATENEHYAYRSMRVLRRVFQSDMKSGDPTMIVACLLSVNSLAHQHDSSCKMMETLDADIAYDDIDRLQTCAKDISSYCDIVMIICTKNK